MTSRRHNRSLSFVIPYSLPSRRHDNVLCHRGNRYRAKGASLMFAMFQNTGTVLIGSGHPLTPLMQKDEKNMRNLVTITFHF